MNVPRWQLKIQARQTLASHRKPFLVIGLTLLGLLTVTYFLQSFFGGLFVMMPLDLGTFPMETGVWPAGAALMGQLLTLGGLDGLAHTGGLVFALRLEAQQIAMVLLMPWGLLGSFLVVQFLVLLVMAPFRMGALEQLRHMLLGHETPASLPYRWYTKPGLLLKSVGLQFLLSLWQWLTRLACLVPGLACSALGSGGDGNLLLLLLALPLTVAGTLGSYWLYCLLLPAQYVLARRPETGLGGALAQGAGLFRGRRKEFFFFRLSFVGWNIVSSLFYSLPDAFIFPYEETATLLFLNTLEGVGETASAE